MRDFGDVANIIRCQFHRDDFMRVGVNTEMQFAPSPARADAVFLIEPLAVAINFEAGAIDQEMQWLRALDPLWEDRQAAAATAERR
jgi:hypothetical protein